MDNTTLPRIRAITDSDLNNVTVAGTQLNLQEIGHMANNRISDSTIYMRSGTKITGNDLDNCHIRVVADGGRGLMVIANNNIDDLLEGQTEAIQVDMNGSWYWSLQITGNNFILQSSDPQAIKVTGDGAATYHLLSIRGNNFLKGDQAINYAGNIKTVVDGNTVRSAALGVSAGGQIQLGTNFSF